MGINHLRILKIQNKNIRITGISLFISLCYFVSSVMFLERNVFEQTIVLKSDSGNKWNEWFKGVFEDEVNSTLRDYFKDDFIRTGVYLHNDENNKVLKIRAELYADTSEVKNINEIINNSLIKTMGSYDKVIDTQLKVFSFFENRWDGLIELLLYSILLFISSFVMLSTVWHKR